MLHPFHLLTLFFLADAASREGRPYLFFSFAAKLGSFPTNVFLTIFRFLLCAVRIHTDSLYRAVFFSRTSTYQDGGHPRLIFAVIKSLEIIMGFISCGSRLISEASGLVLGCARQLVLCTRSPLFLFVVIVTLSRFTSSLCIIIGCSVSTASYYYLFYNVVARHP